MDSLDWYSCQSRVSVQAIAKNNIIEFGFGEQIDPAWGVRTFELIDEGRVEQHPGPNTNKMIAEWLYREITNNDETNQ
jgi:hypothetical protein